MVWGSVPFLSSLNGAPLGQAQVWGYVNKKLWEHWVTLKICYLLKIISGQMFFKCTIGSGQVQELIAVSPGTKKHFCNEKEEIHFAIYPIHIFGCLYHLWSLMCKASVIIFKESIISFHPVNQIRVILWKALFLGWGEAFLWDFSYKKQVLDG